MREFQKRISDIVPVIEESSFVSPSKFIRKRMNFINGYIEKWDKFEVPYLRQADRYLEEGKAGSQRIFLVSDDLNVAYKAAAYLMWNTRNETDEDDYYYDYDSDDEEETGGFYAIQMDQSRGFDPTFPNSFTPLILEVQEEDFVFIYGMNDDAQIIQKCEALEACRSNHQFIWIRKDQVDKSWVQRALLKKEGELLVFDSLENSYYIDLLDYVLQKGGYTLDSNVDKNLLIRKLRQKQGATFREEYVAWALDKAIRHARDGKRKRSKLCLEDFAMIEMNEKKPKEKLDELIGLAEIKKMSKEFAAIIHEENQNKQLGCMRKNMIFYGNPGTGKTTLAQIVAELMVEEGNANPTFCAPGRNEIIGEYVGQTAPKVAKLFEQARGGVLFIDEAGFFLNRSSGGFVDEAMKEFVRYMEVYPDVTVIFAMYEKEVDGFLNLDEGLASRISRFVRFEDYTVDELVAIMNHLLKQKGYTITENGENTARAYFDKQKNEKVFGNARAVRKLVESAIISASVRHYDQKSKKVELSIIDRDVNEAITRVGGHPGRKTFGFSLPNGGQQKVGLRM